MIITTRICFDGGKYETDLTVLEGAEDFPPHVVEAWFRGTALTLRPGDSLKIEVTEVSE